MDAIKGPAPQVGNLGGFRSADAPPSRGGFSAASAARRRSSGTWGRQPLPGGERGARPLPRAQRDDFLGTGCPAPPAPRRRLDPPARSTTQRGESGAPRIARPALRRAEVHHRPAHAAALPGGSSSAGPAPAGRRRDAVRLDRRHRAKASDATTPGVGPHAGKDAQAVRPAVARHHHAGLRATAGRAGYSPTPSTPPAPAPATPPPATLPVDNLDVGELVGRAVRALPPLQREVFCARRIRTAVSGRDFACRGIQRRRRQGPIASRMRQPATDARTAARGQQSGVTQWNR